MNNSVESKLRKDLAKLARHQTFTLINEPHYKLFSVWPWPDEEYRWEPNQVGGVVRNYCRYNIDTNRWDVEAFDYPITWEDLVDRIKKLLQ